MIKVNKLKNNKPWGYSMWLYSPLEEKRTYKENGKNLKYNFLIKIIFANEPLPVQVHPNDQWAKILENQSNGKSESWFTLDDNSKFILGLKNYEEDHIRKHVKNGTFKQIYKWVKLKKGTFVDIPAGLIHAIGPNCKIFEVQQPSDVTYRYYDFDRIVNGKKRDLHIDKCIKVQNPSLNWKLKPICTNPLTYKNDVCIQEFHKKSAFIKGQGIVVDLDGEHAYEFNNENIPFENFVIVRNL